MTVQLSLYYKDTGKLNTEVRKYGLWHHVLVTLVVKHQRIGEDKVSCLTYW